PESQILPNRRVEDAIAGSSLGEQGFHFPSELLVVEAERCEERIAVRRLALQGKLAHLFHLLPTLGSHGCIWRGIIAEAAHEPAFSRPPDVQPGEQLSALTDRQILLQ